jgi:predicted esterase
MEVNKLKVNNISLLKKEYEKYASLTVKQIEDMGYHPIYIDGFSDGLDYALSILKTGKSIIEENKEQS